MVSFRAALPSDYRRIVEMHERQAFSYPLPPPDNIIVKLVAEKDRQIMFAALLRVTSEAYLIGSPEGTPRERWQALLDGNDHLMRAAWDAGLSDINCFVPPPLQKFGKRLRQLGWEKNAWDSYSIWPGNVIAK